MAEIKQAKFIDQTGQEKDAVFIGAEKAIYDDSGKRLDQKLEEREKATGLLASDTQGILGSIGTEVSLQAIIDKLAEKIMRELVSNSSLTQTLANYMTTAMMSGEQINDGNKVPTSALAFAMNQAITQNKNAITQLNSEIIQSSGSAPAIKGNTCTITTIKIKAGHRYIILGKAATSAGNSSIMSCKIQVDSGIAKTTGGSDTRTTMESGGGCVNWMYAEPQTDSVIALRGYGYANIEYNYEGILLGLQLR